MIALFLAACYADAAEPVNDPFEKLNRKVFMFNDVVDRYALRPVAVGYRKITPTYMYDGVNQVFSNIGELPTLINNGLQAKPSHAGKTFLRFLINSTLGFFGFFDVATQLGVLKKKEDFGQTLAVWGVPSGPYLVLPFLGPSTVRDSMQYLVDRIDTYALNKTDISDEKRLGFQGLSIINLRAQLLDVDTLISGDRYLFLRNFYLQNRDYDINDGNVTMDETPQEKIEQWDDDSWLN